VRAKESIAARVIETRESTVLDLLDRLLDKGVVANGDLTLGVAGVDLVYVRLSALLCAADRVFPVASSRRERRRVARSTPRRPRSGS
jgi:gas vesicle protein GvpA/GvpJ/GvpM family